MKAVQLGKVFQPKEFEDRLYQMWMEREYFEPNESGDSPFVIVIPPPNVTGVLHMGHGLNNTLQDILIRYHRMTGRPTLWVPGTDHAGIATQNVVEKQLRSRGTSRKEIGRTSFEEETWKVKEAHHETIVRQLKKIGSSCDWSRERFTLDEGLSRAVREVFVSLYERGLIYRDTYLVNWCPSCHTALSDDEVEFDEVQGRMYHIYYPVEGGGRLEIATTRPETMLGDSAVAVHPEDERYRDYVGRRVRLPLTGRTIPVIEDDYVDRDFGTGAVKITPAHDLNDYEIGKRHGLEEINILNPDGTLSDSVPERYRGKTVKEARKLVTEDLKEQGLFAAEKEHRHQVGHCYRSGDVIEPFLSEQWFVRMRPLAEKALKAWEDGRIVFYPRKWENTYTHWLNNIRDWCISRQLWWGHRIPVWYDEESGKAVVSREDPQTLPEYAGRKLRQEEDVLDTWFSSALWPFSTLGWPEKTEDLQRFYPTSSLVTGYDIIFFWVARMIMMGLEFCGEVPFKDIYITGLVRDIKGRKMSKSLGNGIDPLEVVEEYGADALKFTLAFMAAQGQDILIDKESFKLGSRFANKIWNASRYLLMNLEGRSIKPVDAVNFTDLDRWIYHRLNEASGRIKSAMLSYRFNDACQAAYEFFWNDFCDWYIEASKLSLYSDDEEEKDRAVSLLIAILEESMRLLHPFLSFITEEIYQKLPDHGESVMIAAYPQPDPERESPKTAAEFASVQELVRLVRTLRSELTIPPERKISVSVRVENDFPAADMMRSMSDLIMSLCAARDFKILDGGDAPAGSLAVVGSGFEAYVDVKDAIDIAEELKRLEKDLQKTQNQLQAAERKLQNPAFLERAPEAVVVKEREKQQELSRQCDKLTGFIRELSS